MSKILELRTKRNTLWEQTKDFLEKNRGLTSFLLPFFGSAWTGLEVGADSCASICACCSSRQMDLIVLNRLGVKPEDVGQKHTEPKEPPADPKPSAEPTPPAEPPANSGPILDMDGKTEDGSIPYNILMKQLEYMK